VTTMIMGGRSIGDGAPCFIIAEAGSNHDGKLSQALQLIDVAADAGADAIKFQLFRADRLYPRAAGVSNYLEASRSIYDIIAELEMPLGWLPSLSAQCRDRRIQFLASAFDEASVDALDPFVSGYKVASYEMTHYPLLRHVASKGKPVIVSTGTADFREVADMTGEIARVGCAGLALMQCTAAYPAPLDALNLSVIPTMKRAFGVPVGLSDHSRDPLVGPLAAAAVGANLVEKHFTLSRTLPGPDHKFAVEPDDLARMVRGIHDVERALGSGEKTVHPAETELRRFARRSVFTTRVVAAGDAFTTENLAVLRNGNLEPGLEPRHYEFVLGRHAMRSLPAEHALQPGDYD
jgi:sialic acid synthase SpsE